jgi:hypothetical protein
MTKGETAIAGMGNPRSRKVDPVFVWQASNLSCASDAVVSWATTASERPDVIIGGITAGGVQPVQPASPCSNPYSSISIIYKTRRKDLSNLTDITIPVNAGDKNPLDSRAAQLKWWKNEIKSKKQG